MASASTTSGTAGTSGTGEWAWWPLKVAGSPWNVSDTMDAWGLWNEYDANDPLTSVYAQICAAANPGGSFITGSNKYGYGHATPTATGLQGQNGTTNGAWEIFCEMCLRARAVVFCESVIGDCGAALPTSSPNTALTLGTQAAEVGASVLGTIVPVPGLGAVIGDISGLLSGQEHAQAVSNEKEILCGLAAQYTGLIQNAYAGVESGALSPQACVTYIQGLASNFAQDVEKIVKSCNASCGMIGVLKAHGMLVSYLVGITPIAGGITAPVIARAVTGGISTPPTAEGLIGSDIEIGGNVSQLAPSTAATSAAAATTAAATATGISPTWILIALAIAIVLWTVL